MILADISLNKQNADKRIFIYLPESEALGLFDLSDLPNHTITILNLPIKGYHLLSTGTRSAEHTLACLMHKEVAALFQQENIHPSLIRYSLALQDDPSELVLRSVGDDATVIYRHPLFLYITPEEFLTHGTRQNETKIIGPQPSPTHLLEIIDTLTLTTNA